MKTCPFCSADIEDEDAFCRYCGRALVTPADVPLAESAAGNGMAILQNEAPRGFWDNCGGAISWWLKALFAGFVVNLMISVLFGRQFWSALPGDVVAISIVLLGARRAGQEQKKRSQGCLTISAAACTLFIFINLFRYLSALPTP